MIKYLLVSLFISFIAHTGQASEDHTNHADHLLFLLQHKIGINKLQEQLPKLDASEQAKNLNKQAKHFKKALPKLKKYMAIPETRYPNLDMYAQSLESRSAVLSDYAELLIRFHQQDK